MCRFTQEDIFIQTVLPLVQSVMEGFNGMPPPLQTMQNFQNTSLCLLFRRLQNVYFCCCNRVVLIFFSGARANLNLGFEYWKLNAKRTIILVLYFFILHYFEAIALHSLSPFAVQE